ncbi:hypothetical protein ACHAW5_000199 [Stephanodiscus triporus]|uniref:Uncharacterized protein n=1 Tax=Stephanodiscus triporus TaxID=2934178 RepID=A0ABD3N7R4_9STRA
MNQTPKWDLYDSILANVYALLGFRPDVPAGHAGGGGGRRRRQDFVFGDLCGAPGGFSDLSGVNVDGEGLRWDLDHIMRHHLRPADADGAGSGSFYRVCHGADGTGSVYNWDNVLRLRREVFATVAGDADPSGVREPLVDLESAAHGIAVSKAAAALTLLFVPGTFVPEDVRVPIGWDQEDAPPAVLAVRSDDVRKPISSRTASAERYLVCSAMPARDRVGTV